MGYRKEINEMDNEPIVLTDAQASTVSGRWAVDPVGATLVAAALFCPPLFTAAVAYDVGKVAVTLYQAAAAA